MVKKLTQEFVEKAYRDKGYKLVSKYVNARTPLIVENSNGVELYSNWPSFYSQGQLPQTVTEKGLIYECSLMGYDYISGYKKYGSNTKILVRNKVTGEISETTRHRMITNGTIPDGPLAKHTQAEVEKGFLNQGYKLIDTYLNTNEPVKVISPLGNEWKVSYHAFMSGQRCPMDRTSSTGFSKGEAIIYSILKNNSSVTMFEREKTVYVDDVRHRLDFYCRITRKDITKTYIIEYDGVQHYKTGGWSTEKLVKARAIRDKQKDDWCEKQGYKMIRIPYTIVMPIDILNELSKGLDVTLKLPNDLENTKKEVIARHYLSHTCTETANEFDISTASVNLYFNQVYGMYKEHYLACITYGVDSMWEFKNLVADFYFDNSLEDTMDEFSLSPSGVQKMFKEVYGGYSKGSCLGVTDSTVARYYLDHSKQETMEELNVSASKVINSFLHVYGISKRKYIKKVGN